MPNYSSNVGCAAAASDNHEVAHGFCHCMGAIAGPELRLRLLEMTADRLLTQAKRLCGLLQRLTNRSLAQYRLLPRGQARI